MKVINNVIIIAFIGALLSFFSCVGNKNKIMSEKEFTSYYLEVIKEQFPKFEFVSYQDLVIASKQADTTKSFFLDDAYHTYKLYPKAVEVTVLNHINRMMSILYEGKKPSPINRTKIFPEIKSKDYLIYIRILNKEKENATILYKQYNEDFIIVYRAVREYDAPLIDTEDIENLGIDQDTLLDFSIKNFKNILPDIQHSEENGIYNISLGSTFESSLILLDSLWTKENFNVDGDFVVAIPREDILMITGSNDIAGIKKLKKIAEKIYNEGNGAREISPFLYKWDGKRFEKFVN